MAKVHSFVQTLAKIEQKNYEEQLVQTCKVHEYLTEGIIKTLLKQNSKTTKFDFNIIGVRSVKYFCWL